MKVHRVKLPESLTPGDSLTMLVDGVPHNLGSHTKKLPTIASFLLKTCGQGKADGKWFTFEVDDRVASEVVFLCNAGLTEIVNFWFDRDLCRVMVKVTHPHGIEVENLGRFAPLDHPSVGNLPFRLLGWVYDENVYLLQCLYPFLYNSANFFVKNQGPAISGEHVPLRLFQALLESESVVEALERFPDWHSFDPDALKMLLVACYVHWKEKLRPFDHLLQNLVEVVFSNLDFPSWGTLIFASVFRRMLREFNLETAFRVAFPSLDSRLNRILKDLDWKP